MCDFPADACLGKRVNHSRDATQQPAAELDVAERVRHEAEMRFRGRLRALENEQHEVGRSVGRSASWDGMEWDGIEWDGMESDGMGWDGIRCARSEATNPTSATFYD